MRVHSEANQIAGLLTCASDFSYTVECRVSSVDDDDNHTVFLSNRLC